MVTTRERIADYELVSDIGRSSGGEVHLARPPRRLALNEELVAVKVLNGDHHPEHFRQAARLLQRSAAVAAGASTPRAAGDAAHVVEVYEAGREPGHMWFSMAHHPHGSLVDPATPLSRGDRLAVVAAAARGAHALHEAGLTHGDIKPTNILLAGDARGAMQAAKLADIDLRACLYPGLTLYATHLLADVELTDPAVIHGNATSRASDIWSLGMTLHRVLAGQPVYPIGPDDDMLSTIRHISSFRFQLATSLTAAEAELVGSCLAGDPADRPSTAAALAMALEELT